MKYIESLLLHYGYDADNTGATAVPIYQTSSYQFKSTDHAAKLFSLKESGFIYTRLNNPTLEVLEKRLTVLHNGSAALCVSSGMSAVTYSILNIASSGDNIISTSNLYGGTHTLFHHTLSKMGIHVHFVDSSNPNNFIKAADANTKAFYLETIGNPKNNIDNIEEIAKYAHSIDIPLIVDNTTAPYIFNPFDYGADIAVYSLTKFMTGNGTTIGGAVIEKGDFEWDSGKFPEFTKPDPSYHGLIYWDLFGNHQKALFRGTSYIHKMRLQLLRDIGAVMSPFNAFMTIEGLETLPLRIEKHCKNAFTVACFLEQHEKISWVNYPGLVSHPDYKRAIDYLKGNFGGIIGFGLKGGFEAGKKLIDSIEMIKHLANIGDARTLIIHPASTTHSQMTVEERKSAGVTDDFIRLSIGLENSEDIVHHLNKALLKV